MGMDRTVRNIMGMHLWRLVYNMFPSIVGHLVALQSKANFAHYEGIPGVALEIVPTPLCLPAVSTDFGMDGELEMLSRSMRWQSAESKAD